MASRFARARATRPRGRYVPRQAFPSSAERAYERTLIGLVREMTSAVARAMAHALGGRTDADEPNPFARVRLPDIEIDEARAERLRTAIRGVEMDFASRMHEVKAKTLARGVGRNVTAQVEAEVDRQVKTAVRGLIPVDVITSRQAGVTQPLIDAWARENVALIKTVNERYFSQLEAVVKESVQVGRRASALTKLVEERGSVAGYNARRIARDQISKLTGKITEARQRALGVERYVWRTSGDERVRPEHAALEGETFRWSDPPDVGHPGEDIQCRCRAEPVIDDILEGL